MPPTAAIDIGVRAPASYHEFVKLSSVPEEDDEPTADLLTQRMQVHEKTAWMLRSLLE